MRSGPRSWNGRPRAIGSFRTARGQKIVRVKIEDEEASIHLDDGTILHVLAVVNEDGCRAAVREEREDSRGASSLLDRLLGRLR